MLIQADSALIPLPDKSVHTVVTSPPYWGLRKYAGDQAAGMFPDLGLEPTPQEHVERIVAIMAEVHRVLRDDGVVWLNYGDCYASGTGRSYPRDYQDGGAIGTAVENTTPRFDLNKIGFPAGNLMLMPHRIAIALQNWGWVVRNDVVWFKRNPMPESQAGWRFERQKERIKSRGKSEAGNDKYENMGAGNPHASRDGYEAEYEYLEDYHLRKGSWRHTRAHEYVFMLTKKMQYWSNQEAVRENQNSLDPNHPTFRKGWLGDGYSSKGERYLNKKKRVETGRVWDSGWAYRNPSGRNPRSVMDVPTRPYKGAHYATFPPNLIAPLIRATCPRWACPVCGQGWSPVVEKPKYHVDLPGSNPQRHGGKGDDTIGGGQKRQDWLNANPPQIKSYRPTCEHEHTKDEAVPGICLDPFVGSGTTVMVAKQLLRRGIGLDISMEYIDQQAKVRTGEGSPSGVLDDLPLFALMDEEV